VSSPPVLIKVPAKSEDKIEWKLPEARESSKVFAAFLPADGESSREMEALLQRFSEQKEGNGPAAQRLYDRLSEWAGEDRTGSASEGEQIVELGAAMSTSLMSPEASRPRVGDDVSPQGANMESQNPAAAFDWRKNSRQAAFGADVHPVVIYDFVSAGR
jgi:hypothetical protein